MGYTFASFFGSPMAGITAAVLAWQSVFVSGTVIMTVMAIVAFLCFSLFERNGIVKYGQYKRSKEKGQGVGVLIKHRIIKFTLISMITGVIRTSVVFWMPTYIAQHLGFSSEQSAMIFTVATFVISLTTFITIFIYEKLGNNMDLTILLMFITSAIAFAALFAISEPVVNICIFVVAIMASNGAATMLWSRYCPSLRDTGMVSSATGFLDFVSYMSAAVSTTLFANAVNVVGWGNLILIWLGLVVCGIVVALPYQKLKKSKV